MADDDWPQVLHRQRRIAPWCRAHERLVAYAASKGGLEMVNRTLAVDWVDRGIRVNSGASGYPETETDTGWVEHEVWGARLLARIPMGRFGATTDVVPAVLSLAGASAADVTGTSIVVDGGRTAT